MNKEAKKLYENKYFYKVIKLKPENIQLSGPFDNIYYTTKETKENGITALDGTIYPKGTAYVLIVEGMIVETFTEEEILVSDHKL